MPLDGLRATAGDRAEWRLGFLPDSEIRRALSEATVALFPYRSEIDVSGALLQVLGAGVPAIVYDIGGIGEVVARFGAGAVVEPGDVGGMALALEQLLGDRDALAAARKGAEDARARAHLGGCRAHASRALPGARVRLGRSRFRRSWNDSSSSSRPTSRRSSPRRERADAAATSASAEESEELYGDFQLVVDAVGERLYDMREAFAGTLEDGDGDEYRATFDKAARKRFGVLASFLEDES